MKPEKSPSIPTAVWVLGIVSLLMDVSSELVHSLLPVFLVTVLGASAMTVGFIEGVAESTALIVKVFSGPLSDYFARRKPLAVLGYALGALSKPLFAMATSTGIVFTARVIDRIGKGVRGAPRDALVADLTVPEIRGSAYGLRQALDTIGAFVGPLLAVALMLLWANDIRAIFWVAVIPGVLAVGLLIVGVREPRQRRPVGRVNPVHWKQLKRLSRNYWRVVAVGALFALARFSEAFLLLKAEHDGLALAWTPLVLVLMNVVYASFAYPFGRLSDRIGYYPLLTLGLLVLIAADLVLAYSVHRVAFFAGVGLWGLHMAITQGLLATMVANTAPTELRGTAFGVFNLLSGVAMLGASLLAGFLWDQFGPSYTFLAGIVFCGLALLIVIPGLRACSEKQ